MALWIRYSVVVYLGLLLAGTVGTPWASGQPQAGVPRPVVQRVGHLEPWRGVEGSIGAHGQGMTSTPANGDSWRTAH